MSAAPVFAGPAHEEFSSRNRGGAVAAGIVAGLIGGALIGAATAPAWGGGYHAAPAYGHGYSYGHGYGYGPVYASPGPVYVVPRRPRCFVQTDPWGGGYWTRC